VSDGGGSYHGGVSHVTYYQNQGNKASHKNYPQRGGSYDKPHPGNSGNHGNDKSHHDNGHN
jgi:hypothetical protein